MTDLSARLAEAKGNNSIDAIVERAARAGHEINRATVARYIAGDGAKRPPDKVLRALAVGFSLDVRELRELARVPRGELGEWKPPAESARLNVDQRKALDHLIKTIVAGEEQAHGNAAPITPLPKPPTAAELAGEGDNVQDLAADEEDE